jgi:hypothetical protein
MQKTVSGGSGAPAGEEERKAKCVQLLACSLSCSHALVSQKDATMCSGIRALAMCSSGDESRHVSAWRRIKNTMTLNRKKSRRNKRRKDGDASGTQPNVADSAKSTVGGISQLFGCLLLAVVMCLCHMDFCIYVFIHSLIDKH